MKPVRDKCLMMRSDIMQSYEKFIFFSPSGPKQKHTQWNVFAIQNFFWGVP